jgi:hypothetical protein
MSIFYHKINRYILTITVDVNDCSTFTNVTIHNPLQALYFTKKIYILSIEDFTTNEILKKIEINKNYIFEINNEYNFMEYIGIFKLKECALYYNFLPHKDFELFNSGYSGIVKIFNPDGILESEGFMINSVFVNSV